MVGRKRSTLTTDDRLRHQDEVRRKRTKLLHSDSDISNIEEADSSTEENSLNEGRGRRVKEEKSHIQETSSSDEDSQTPAEEQKESRISFSSTYQDRFHTSITRKEQVVARTPSIKNSISFSSLGISTSLQSALLTMSIRSPTEVQAACIPPLLSGRDCIGNAKTGSGKTIAFALPILQQLAVDPYGIYALILTPTRLLAFQISEQFAVLGSPLNIRTAVVVGGMDMIAQSLELNSRPHIVIATPGRIVDHLRSGSGEWNLSRVKFLVLDEADRLLTPTFTPELTYLFGVLPQNRQTCLFTATLTPPIEVLANAPPRPDKQKPFIHRTSEIVETVSTLQQYYVLVPSHIRECYLYYLLCNPPESTIHLRRTHQRPSSETKPKGRQKTKKSSANDHDEEPEQPPPTIIFCTKPRTAAYLTLFLKSLSIRSTALHSRLTQRERLSSLSLFRAYIVPVLISTDVGARGLDIEDVAMVINWDMSNEPEEYTHRVGRTARAGRGGMAVSFVTERDEERVLKIEERIKTKLVEMCLPEAQVLEKLNKVMGAKRVANMELHDSNFGKREEIHKIKYKLRHV